MLKKIIHTYKNVPKQVKASLWFIVSNILVKGISFITLPIFSRLLTTEEYGVVSVYQSWVSVVSIITTLTIWGGVFNVGMVKYSEKRDQMISSFQGLAITITLFFGIISIVVFPILQPLFKMSRLLTICLFLEIMAQIPFYLWSTEQRYLFEYKRLIYVTVLISVLNPVLGVVAVTNTPYKAEARIISGLAVQMFVGLLLFFYNQHRGKSFYNKEFWRFGFLFNIILVPHYLSMQVLNQSDRIMINNMCGSSDAGVYSVAYNFALLLSLVTNGINSSLTPHIYQCLKNGNEKSLKKQTTAVIAIVAVITVGMIAIIPDLFHILLPSSYYGAIKVIPPVAAGAFFLFLYPLFGSIEFYYEENRYVTVASTIGAILNILLNYIFIKAYGFIAAAYTTLFCYICFSVCHYFFMKRVIKKHKNDIEIYNAKGITAISLFVIILSVLMVIVYDLPLIRWITISIILLFGIWKRGYIINTIISLKSK